MRLGYATEDNDKRPVARRRVSIRTGFPTTPSKPTFKPKAKPKPKIIIHSRRTGFPTTPDRPTPERPVILKPKAETKAPPKPIIHRKETVSGENLVSIIILNFNTLEVLKPCVESVVEKTVHPYELIVVDNGSTDGSVQWAKNHKGIHTVVENRWNHGWTKGNNIGIRSASGNYFLLLNSDILVRTKGWVGKMVKCAESNPLVGTVGAILLYPNGAIQHIGGGIHLQGSPYHPFDYRSDVRGRNKPTKLPPQIKTNRAVPYVTGACLLIKRSTISKVGFLDEGFRLGFGDVDYGLSVVMAGLKNMVCADVVLMHRWAYTMRKLKHKTLVHEWPSSTKRYFSKWKHRINELNKLVKIEW